MTMPTIPEENFRPNKDEVIIDLLKSIALEENAIAHLLNAEAEKIQAFVGKDLCFPSNPSHQTILQFNAQIFKVLDLLVMKEWLLLRKLEDVISYSDIEINDHDHHHDEEE